MSDQNNLDENNINEEAIEASINNDVGFNAPVPNLFPSTEDYYIRFAHDPSRFLSNSNLILGPGTRAQIVPYPSDRVAALRMRLIHNPANNTYRIRNNAITNTPRELVSINSTIIAYFSSTPPGEGIIINPVRNGIYELISSQSNRYYGVTNLTPASARDVHLSDDFSIAQREWYITTDPNSPLPPVLPVEEGIYTIHARKQPSSVIESPLRTNDESEPFIKNQDGVFTQLWQFVYDPELNAYQIISYMNECLFAYDSGIPGTPPRQRYRIRFTSRLNQTPASYWYVNPQVDGSVTIVSVKYPDQKFDLTLGNTENFTPIQLYQRNEYDAQNWLLKRVV